MKPNKQKPESHLRCVTRPAFTLVELLVTIVIIASLAALGFAGYNKMRANANRTVSLNNISNLQIVNALYASDNNGRYISTFAKDSDGKTSTWPRNPDFLDLMLSSTDVPRGGQANRVPQSMLDPTAYKARANSFDKLWGSYGMFSRVGFNSGSEDVDSSYSIGELSEPHRTAAFTTAVNWLVQYGGRFHWDGTEGKVNQPAMAYRHNDKSLVVFYDGHVEEVSKSDIRAIDNKGGRRHPFWAGAAN